MPWPKDSAGHRMTAKVPVAAPEETVAAVRERILADITAFTTINYVYVLDRAKKLLGVLSLKDLYRAPPEAQVGEVGRRTSLVTVKPEAHQERVVYLALKNNIKSVPVVDAHHVFLGVIPSDAILGILYKEAHEDLLRLAGFRHPRILLHNVLDLPILTSFIHRAPWLLIGLLGGFAAASVIGSFEATLAENMILASFIPLIVYMSDAVGTQMEVSVIRDLAVEHALPFRRYFIRQLAIVLLLSLSFGIILALGTTMFYGDHTLGTVLGLGLAAAITSSVFTGLLIPYAFSRMKLDPADASGPLATIIQDIVSIVAYFTIATLLL